MPAPRLPLFLLVLLALPLSGCLAPEQPKDTHDTGFWLCDAEAQLQPVSPALSGDSEISFLLVHPESQTAEVRLSWSSDGGVLWQEASVDGQTEDLETSPEGVSHTLVWRTLDDLGYKALSDIQLKLVARSRCGLWPRELLTDLTIDNSMIDESTCDVELISPVGPAEGSVTLQFKLAHAESTPVWIDPAFTRDEGKTWEDLAWVSEDCDNDGIADGIAELESSPLGTDHCLVWESQEDLALDANIRVRVSCGVGFDVHDESVSDTFSVTNDPLPDPDELIITELLPLSSHSAGDYLEILNRAEHTLDLEGVLIQRWRAGTSTTGPATATFTISDVTGTVLLEPGALLLLAASEDREDNGCIDPDLTWGGFTLNDNSVLHLSLEELVLAELSLLDSDGWDFSEGVALGLDPERAQDPDWDSSTAWCAQRTRIPSCSATSVTDDGTPGLQNDTCP